MAVSSMPQIDASPILFFISERRSPPDFAVTVVFLAPDHLTLRMLVVYVRRILPQVSLFTPSIFEKRSSAHSVE
jgi:hypothetical protein